MINYTLRVLIASIVMCLSMTVLAECYQPSPLELEARANFLNKQRNLAREKVEHALALANGQNISIRSEQLKDQHLPQGPQKGSKPVLAAFVLAQIYEVAEGNFPKALFWMKQSERWLIDACGAKPKSQAAIQIHRDSILGQSFLLGDMDRRSEQLAELDRYNEIYPSKDELKIWPLVKLGRFEEAREIGIRLIKSVDPFVRSRSYNGLMAVECEARNRKASYDWGLKGHEDARESSCVIALNMGLASRQCFKFDEEERFNRIALKAEDQDCSSSPYIQSSATYLIRGAFQKSIAALSKWAPKTAMEWSQSHMRVKARRAELMFSLGVWERGMNEVHQVVTYPDRSAGTDSASEELLNLEASLLYWTLLKGQSIILNEQQKIRGYWSWLMGSYERGVLAFRRWKQGRQVIRYATHQALLIDLLRPYYSNVHPWYASSLAHLFGTGLLEATLSKVRELEAADYPDVVNAYLNAFEAELALLNKEYQDAHQKAQAALKQLPEAAKLLRYRVQTIKWIADQQDRTVAALDNDLHILLSKYPTFIRFFEAQIPVSIEHEGRTYSDQIIDALGRSPRFELRTDAQLKMKIMESDQKLQICMFGPQGYRYGCAETFIDLAREKAQQEKKMHHGTNKKRNNSANQDPQSSDLSSIEESQAIEPNPVFRLIDRLHATLFSPRIELSQRELDTLDGNTRQISAEDALRLLNP